MAIPPFLYHYTSVESLACILKHATFRFSRIDKMNDPLDGLCSDVEGARKHIFVSSWTANPDDQIPMWKMYTGDMSGVRICLPSHLFTESQRLEVFDLGIEGEYVGCRCAPFPIDHQYLGAPMQIEYIFGPLEVSYQDFSEEASKKCSAEYVAPTGITVKSANLNYIGDTKDIHWGFEQEWRYRVYATPTGFPVLGSHDFSLNQLLPGIDLRYIDVPIDKNSFNEMEVLIGPRGAEAQEIIVGGLISMFAPNAKIFKSKIAIV